MGVDERGRLLWVTNNVPYVKFSNTNWIDNLTKNLDRLGFVSEQLDDLIKVMVAGGPPHNMTFMLTYPYSCLASKTVVSACPSGPANTGIDFWGEEWTLLQKWASGELDQPPYSLETPYVVEIP